MNRNADQLQKRHEAIIFGKEESILCHKLKFKEVLNEILKHPVFAPRTRDKCAATQTILITNITKIYKKCIRVLRVCLIDMNEL